MNYMSEVAKMLGVEIGEEFKISESNARFKLTESELVWYSTINKFWMPSEKRLNQLLNGEVVIIKNILDEKEKEYLSAVIRPFRDKIKSICKSSFHMDDIREWIQISFISDEFMYFPYFKKGTMYKGMENDREYTLEELNI